MTPHQRRRSLVWILLPALSVALIAQCLMLFRAASHNHTIEKLLAGADITITADESPELVLARTYSLMRRNRADEALELFNQLQNKGDEEFQSRLRYNLGNLYLSQALDLVTQGGIGRAFTLASLAKDSYREALRLNSQDWDAKYNLEVAMRLVPDLSEADLSEFEEQEQGRGLWSTVPGFPRGLP